MLTTIFALITTFSTFTAPPIDSPCESSFATPGDAAASMCDTAACCYYAGNGNWNCGGFSQSSCDNFPIANWETCPSGMCFAAPNCRYGKDSDFVTACCTGGNS